MPREGFDEIYGSPEKRYQSGSTPRWWGKINGALKNISQLAPSSDFRAYVYLRRTYRRRQGSKPRFLTSTIGSWVPTRRRYDGRARSIDFNAIDESPLHQYIYRSRRTFRLISKLDRKEVMHDFLRLNSSCQTIRLIIEPTIQTNRNIAFHLSSKRKERWAVCECIRCISGCCNSVVDCCCQAWIICSAIPDLKRSVLLVIEFVKKYLLCGTTDTDSRLCATKGPDVSKAVYGRCYSRIVGECEELERDT